MHMGEKLHARRTFNRTSGTCISGNTEIMGGNADDQGHTQIGEQCGAVEMGGTTYNNSVAGRSSCFFFAFFDLCNFRFWTTIPIPAFFVLILSRPLRHKPTV